MAIALGQENLVAHSAHMLRPRILLIVCVLFFGLFSGSSFGGGKGKGGDVYVRGYYRSNGTYVQPHMRSAPDGDFSNNWSTLGNVNPYTGEPGSKTAPSATLGGYGSPVSPPSAFPSFAPSGRGLGTTTACGYGHRLVGDRCVAVAIPEHGQLDYTGHGWTCEQGYRNTGVGCVAVAIPENGQLDYTGHGWTCQQGYRNTGAGCVAVAIPENGQLDYTGHGWTCQQGYRNTGVNCAAVAIPENGRLDYTGHGWSCQQGYRNTGVSCVALER